MSQRPSAAQVEKLKKEKQEREQKMKEQKKLLEEQKKIIQQERQNRVEKLTPLVKFARQKDRLKEKDAIWHDKRVKFFRADAFQQFLIQNEEKIRDLVPTFDWEEQEEKIQQKIKNNELSKQEQESSQNNKKDQNDENNENNENKDIDLANDYLMYKFLEHLLQEKYIIRYERFQEEGEAKLKYPKRLLLNQVQQPGPSIGVMDKCFYSFDVELKSKSMPFYSFLLIFGICAVCLFPVWPLVVKKAIFHLSLSLLIVLVGISVFRLVLWMFMRTLGFDFWFLPNFYNDDVSFVGQFLPVISCEVCNDRWWAFIVRALALVCFVYWAAFFWEHRQVVQEQTIDLYDEVYEWGLNKMINPDLPGRALPGIEEFMEEDDIQQNNQQQQQQDDDYDVDQQNQHQQQQKS